MAEPQTEKGDVADVISRALHEHVCGPWPQEICCWMEETSTCAEVVEQTPGMALAVQHALTEVGALSGAKLREVAADLYRNHDMPPRKDSRSYSYRNGWWDGVHHAAKVVERAARQVATPPRTADSR